MYACAENVQLSSGLVGLETLGCRSFCVINWWTRDFDVTLTYLRPCRDHVSEANGTCGLMLPVAAKMEGTIVCVETRA